MAQQVAQPNRQAASAECGRSSVSRVGSGGGWRRNAGVLVWTPVLLLGPVLDLHGSAGAVVFQVAMIVVIAASAVTIALPGGPPWRSRLAPVALSTLVAATFAGATHASSQWLPTWILLAN